MEREKRSTGNSAELGKQRRAPKPIVDDDDPSLTEVGEEHEFKLWDELDNEERRRDPLRSSR